MVDWSERHGRRHQMMNMSYVRQKGGFKRAHHAKVFCKELQQGSFYYQPKQCTIKWKYQWLFLVPLKGGR